MSAGERAAFAAAKVNLCLHVGPRGQDGYHAIASLMVFADVGDRVLIGGEGLSITGPLAKKLSSGPDNLVAKATAAFEQATGLTAPGLILEKALPVGAGLGGGSADAAAALQLLNTWAKRPLGEAALADIAARLGSDVAACLESKPVIAEGRGERLSPAPRLPVLDAVLIHPGPGSSTPVVYRAFDEKTPGGGDLRLPPMPAAFANPNAVIAYLTQTRNDLYEPAMRLQPAIMIAQAALDYARESLFVRMTGSGSAVFALCRDAAAAGRLAERFARANPTWWVRACRLGGPQTA